MVIALVGLILCWLNKSCDEKCIRFYSVHVSMVTLTARATLLTTGARVGQYCTTIYRHGSIYHDN